jgi:hypothetical protein
MNTGLQDAHNLAWKLALALRAPSTLKPHAPHAARINVPHLLSSYQVCELCVFCLVPSSEPLVNFLDDCQQHHLIIG